MKLKEILKLTSQIKTHDKINHSLCGKPEYAEEGKSRVCLELTENMKVDNSGLVHGGFIFGLADHAAMLSINHPNVVLYKASCTFLKPSVKGDILIADAEIIEKNKNRYKVLVKVKCLDTEIFQGEFIAVIPKNHVLL